MPVPTLITELSTTAASNYPAGTDSPATLDDVQRAHGAFIAQIRDGVVAVAGTGLTGTASALSIGGNAATATNATNATNVTGTIASGVTATTQTAGDNSTKVATTAFVRSVGPSYGSITGFSANTTLTSANYGNFIYVNGTFTLTLPVADAANIGRTITCYGYAAASVTVATQSSQLLYYQGTNTATSAAMIGVGDTVTFVNYNGTAWMAMGANALGTGQTWQNVIGSRLSGTTYYNTTGKPILVSVTVSGGNSTTLNLVVGGVTVCLPNNANTNNTSGIGIVATGVVPPGASYSATQTGSTITAWAELR